MVRVSNLQKSKRHGWLKSKKVHLLLAALIGAAIYASRNRNTVPSFGGLISFEHASAAKNRYDFHVDKSCTDLPSIRASGSYFLDSKIEGGVSPDSIRPSFKVGSLYAQKVPYHMNGDAANFHLLKEVITEHGEKSGLAFDIGANQGFYTYYMATLGMHVHAFEINEDNFKSLQHGAEFNPRAVSDRINLYPVGLGEKNGRFGMQGSNYEGFLKEKADAPIQGVSFDCFADHMKGKLDISNIAFIKLDVEGFETAVLKGFHNSLYKYSKIGGMLMEVGPSRWQRANVDLATGTSEMELLAKQFKSSYIILRSGNDKYGKTCPGSIATDTLADKNPETLEGGSNKYVVKSSEWKPLLALMNQHKYDCNLFYKN